MVTDDVMLRDAGMLNVPEAIRIKIRLCPSLTREQPVCGCCVGFMAVVTASVTVQAPLARTSMRVACARPGLAMTASAARKGSNIGALARECLARSAVENENRLM